MLALNPRGQVPVLKDGDVVISESLATLEYLDEAYPDPSLVPKGASPQVRQESPIEVKKTCTCLPCPRCGLRIWCDAALL